jgi:L-ascorbate metabolism protein UlaG (beta-lactamase superfamily)
MIEPVESGEVLAKSIETAPMPGRLVLWWLGQSGYLVRSSNSKILIDPYLSESLTLKYAATDKPHIRMTRCPIDPASLSGIDVVVCSHKHSDHMDPGTLPALASASPRCVFVVPSSLVVHAELLGLPRDRIMGIDHAGVLEFPDLGLRIRAMKAAHEGLDTDSAGRFLYLSFVIDFDGIRLFHSGDSMVWPAMAETIGDGVDIAFLPINGRDPARKVAGNMNSEEAIALAAEFRPGILIPHHYDMFTFNTVDPVEFVQASRLLPPTIRPVILRCGERFETDSHDRT